MHTVETTFTAATAKSVRSATRAVGRTKTALERMIFPWVTTSLLFRHRLYSLLRFFSWLIGLVGSTLILVWSSSRGCFEVPNDTWTLEATLALESTQCGFGPGMWCLSFSILINFATVLAMELLEGR